jgi:tetratricopeptide (TPR) repeat protein
MGTSQLKAALADFDKAIEMSPKWARPHANRGVALVHLGRLAEAEPSLVRAREMSDNDFVVHQGFGLLRMQQDRLDEALASLSRAIELDPDNSFSLSRRALVYRLQGRFTEAVADLEEILSFDPENEGAAVQLASIHTGLGKADAAIAAFARIKEAAEVPHLQEAKASMLEMFGRTAEATAIRAKIIAGFDAELAKTPHDPAITADKARMLIDKGEHKAAVALLNAALARFAGSTSLLQARCLARAAGNFELPAAQKDCDAAVSNDAGDLYSRLTRATLAMRQARFDPAIADCAAALAASEMMAPCYYVRGAARFAKGEKEAAERDLQRARRLDPTVDLQFRKLGLRGLPEARAEAAAAQ